MTQTATARPTPSTATSGLNACEPVGVGETFTGKYQPGTAIAVAGNASKNTKIAGSKSRRRPTPSQDLISMRLPFFKPVDGRSLAAQRRSGARELALLRAADVHRDRALSGHHLLSESRLTVRLRVGYWRL